MSLKVSLPPEKLMTRIGSNSSQSFIRVGKKRFEAIKTLCNIESNDKILDIGCGCGRIAIQAIDYLDKMGIYKGFDCDKELIDWCRENISTVAPNFSFQHINVYNGLYASKSKNMSSTFVFPYEDNYFDIVILTSIFTHLLTDDMINYINEIYRVLKKGGKCYCTFFLSNETSGNECFRIYDETFVKNLWTNTGFIIGNTLYGTWKQEPYNPNWSNKEYTTDYQDTMIIIKT